MAALRAQDLSGCGEAALGALRSHRALCDPATERSAARMDAALKRSRSEEPPELPLPAREVEEKEEEEEERMEQGLEEEEEEVDPRIQVGRVRGAHSPTPPGLPWKSASTRTHTLQPRVSAVAGGGRLGPGSAPRLRAPHFTVSPREAAVPAWTRPDYCGDPCRPSAQPEGPCNTTSGSGGLQQREKGAGAPEGSRGTLAQLSMP